ncbi:NAD-dependent epimerase/dehydratase family protein [Sciscionella marina]|uniref:NAD-dependent epimerase/dehydratase family protein n=1 Tax=Sciscionella marina TaxID=508770 RepID=UPI00036BFA20|nr:NAD(P)-dependent oxidoreductase [Sciscionella marina]
MTTQGSPVLVTGATGRVGSRLVDTLLDQGRPVRAVVLPEDPGRAALPEAVEAIEGSLTDPAVVAEAVDGVGAAVHLAATMDWGPGANDRLFEANVRATYLLFEALAGRDSAIGRGRAIERVVLASSDEVYPALQVGEPIAEERPLAPYSFYGLTKELDERLAAYYHRTGLAVTVARFSLVAAAEEITHPDGWSGRLFFGSGLRTLLTGLGRTEAVAALDAQVPDQESCLVLARDEQDRPYRFQFCDVRDLVHGLDCLLREPAVVGETVNLSGPTAFGYDEVVPELAERIGVRYREIRLPGPRFDVEIETAKAVRLAGYRPRYDVRTIIDQLN